MLSPPYSNFRCHACDAHTDLTKQVAVLSIKFVNDAEQVLWNLGLKVHGQAAL